MQEGKTFAESATTVCYEAMDAHARRLIQAWLEQLLEVEVTEFLGRGKSQRQAATEPLRPGYRNGYGKPRHLALTSGTITVRRPRVRNLSERFGSRVLPLFKRRTNELGALLPRLCLLGLASGDFELALRGLLGEAAPVSASALARLKRNWQTEYAAWKGADLSELEVVHCWADGLYVDAGIAERKTALLIIVGATADGEKVLLACQAGERAGTDSWLDVLRDLQARGLQGLQVPHLTVADDHLGIWEALSEIGSAAGQVPSGLARVQATSSVSR